MILSGANMEVRTITATLVWVWIGADVYRRSIGGLREDCSLLRERYVGVSI